MAENRAQCKRNDGLMSRPDAKGRVDVRAEAGSGVINRVAQLASTGQRPKVLAQAFRKISGCSA